MEDIKVTLETLYDILRNEKKKEELQTLEETFFADVVSYLREKKAFLDLKKDEDNLFASGEKDKLEYEVRSIKRILKEIYEKREKKMIDIALNKSRTGSEIIDTGSMLKEEKEFYHKILNVLDLYRKGVVLNLFEGKLPRLLDENVCFEVKKDRVDKKPINVKTGTENTSGSTINKFDDSSEDDTSETTGTKDETTETDSTSKDEPQTPVEMMKIKMIKPMPSFVWKDLKVYGPYDVDDEVEIFPEVAELMVRKGRAEKV